MTMVNATLVIYIVLSRVFHYLKSLLYLLAIMVCGVICSFCCFVKLSLMSTG